MLNPNGVMPCALFKKLDSCVELFPANSNWILDTYVKMQTSYNYILHTI
jgi:hypothetical protein